MDVYKAPAAQVELPVEVPARPIRGVILGAIADLVVSAALFISFTLFMGAYMAAKGSSQEDVTRFFMSLEQDNSTLIASYVMGSVGSLMGGYVCARNARVNEYAYGCVLATIMSLLSGALESDLGSLATGIAFTWLAVMAGCHWGRVRNQQERV